MSAPLTRTELEQRIAAVTAFMGTEVYRQYLVWLQTEQMGIQESILMRPPTTPQESGEVCMLHGELRRVASELTIFESMRNGLKQELEKLPLPPVNEVTDTSTE